MPEHRLPRMLFFSWVPDCARKRGRPQKHFGHYVKDTLIAMVESIDSGDARQFKLGRNEKLTWRTIKGIADAFQDCAHWMRVAQNRNEWKRLTRIYLDNTHVS